MWSCGEDQILLAIKLKPSGEDISCEQSLLKYESPTGQSALVFSSGTEKAHYVNGHHCTSPCPDLRIREEYLTKGKKRLFNLPGIDSVSSEIKVTLYFPQFSISFEKTKISRVTPNILKVNFISEVRITNMSKCKSFYYILSAISCPLGFFHIN